MTELEQTRAMLRRAKIPFTEEEAKMAIPFSDQDRVVNIDVERGYAGFHAVLTFRYDTGELIDVAAWE